MSSNAASTSVVIKSPPEDFKGEVSQSKLVPFERVDYALCSPPGSPFEHETRFINDRLTEVWKNIPKSLRDLWLFGVQVSLDGR